MTTTDADYLVRPISGIEYRASQEMFDIMSDRIRSALLPNPPDQGSRT